MSAVVMLKVSLIALMTSFWVCLFIVISQRWHGTHTLDHDLDGVQKFHTRAVPRIGGIAVFIGITCSLSFLLVFYRGDMAGLHAMDALKLIVASLPAFIAGLIEDMSKKVSVRIRMVATILSALMASVLLGATLQHVDIWGVDDLLGWIVPLTFLVTAVVVAGGTNAINIIDGFNGLSGGVILIISAALGFLGWQVGDMLVVTLALLSFSVIIGFLLINYPTGYIFLGDGGAYFLGFWMSEIAVLLLVRNPSINAWQVLSICAYPVIEVLYSIYRRRMVHNAYACGPDGLHLHTLIYHRLTNKVFSTEKPWSRNAAVAIIMLPWIALFGLMSVVSCDTIFAGVLLVISQVCLYIFIYKGLARGYSRDKNNMMIDIDTI